MADVLIALGGNVGDVRATYQKAIANICGMTQGALLARSSDYSTPPWGDEQQAAFINACIEIETGLDPHALLFTLHRIEKKFGRDRGSERRWGPRTLDLDLIAYDDVSIHKPELTLPHPRLFERAFVLVPLAEIAPYQKLVGKTYDGLRMEPIYRRARGAAPIAGRAPAAPWQIMQRIDHPDAAQANAQALHDLENGASGLTLIFGGANGAHGFGLEPTAEAVEKILDGVFIDAGIALELQLGTQSRMAAMNVAEYVKRKGLSAAACHVRFGLDPIGACAVSGSR